MIERIVPGMGRMMLSNISTEILYSFIIISCSLMIYFGTKRIYEISLYKGIKYFRQAFLFFALAYFFRSFIKITIFYFNSSGILSIPSKMLNPIIGPVTLLLFMYFSSMGIFYLLYSVMYKKWAGDKINIFHLIAASVSLFIFISNNIFYYLLLNLGLFLFSALIVYLSYNNSLQKEKKRKHNFYAIYVLLSFFWFLNIIDILIPHFFQTIQILFYVVSSGIFLFILYKVIKKIGND